MKTKQNHLNFALSITLRT